MLGKVKEFNMICSQKEIKKIMQTGTYFSGEYLKFIYIKNTPSKNNLELLISVPKKKIKLAVKRNSIKRKIKSFFIQKNNKLHTNIQLIIVYRYFKPVKYIKLEEDILSFLKLFQ